MPNAEETDDKKQLAWVRRRLAALEKIEVKLKEMRELAAYAASRPLSAAEAVQMQEWVDILQTEARELDKSTSVETLLRINHFIRDTSVMHMLQ